MIEYHKIQSVYLRDPATKFRTFLTGQYAEPAFEYLAHNPWTWTEKIDGTNIRVVYNGEAVRFGGRTNDAQMPTFLMEKLHALFTVESMRVCFPDIAPPPPDTTGHGTEVYLFGEGYGAKIQKPGGRYIPTGCSFILFDVMVGHTYLERHNVEDIAAKLGVRVVPIVGRGSLHGAIEFAREGYKSDVAADGSLDAEGLVLRPECELLDRMGRRIITKVKARDFVNEAVAA